MNQDMLTMSIAIASGIVLSCALLVATAVILL
jgi:hypothetical protein